MNNIEKVSLLVDLQKASQDQVITESLRHLKHGDYLINLWEKTIEIEMSKMLGGDDKLEGIKELSDLKQLLTDISNTPVVGLLKQLNGRLMSSAGTPAPAVNEQSSSTTAPTTPVRNPSGRSGIYPY